MEDAMKFSEIKVGHRDSCSMSINIQDAEVFTYLTADYNTIHQGEDGIVHGMLVASQISTLIGTKIPGDGAIWKSQTIKFVNPVRVGDTITVKGEVTGRDAERKEITIYTDIYNQRDEVVLYGTAVVKCTR